MPEKIMDIYYLSLAGGARNVLEKKKDKFTRYKRVAMDFRRY